MVKEDADSGESSHQTAKAVVWHSVDERLFSGLYHKQASGTAQNPVPNGRVSAPS